MKITKLGFIVIAIIMLGIFYFFPKIKNSFIDPNNTPSPSVAENTPQPTIDNSDLRAGGSSYSDPQGVYVFLYPADYKLDTKDKQHIRIYKTGATQKGQTEIYDGVIMVFETISLNGKTFQKWLDEYLKQMTADGTSEIIAPPKNIMLNNYSGVTYKIRSLGQSTYYVLQKDMKSNYAIVIATSVNDPQNVGFQTEVDKTLSTLEILK